MRKLLTEEEGGGGRARDARPRLKIA